MGTALKPSKLRDMTVDELNLQESQIIDQIFRLRFQIAASQVENPTRVHTLRKDLARVKTILLEKHRAAAKAGAATVSGKREQKEQGGRKKRQTKKESR